MNKIFANSEEKFLKRIEVFAKGDNQVLTFDKKGENKIPFEGLIELLVKNLIVVNVADTYQVPVGFKVNTNVVEVYCLDVSTATVEKKTYKSANKIS